MKFSSAAFAITLTACSFGERPVTDKYTLKPDESIVAATQKPFNLTLQVNDPNAGASIDTRRIAVMTGSNKIDYYQNVTWSASAPDLFGSILVDSFERAKIFANVNSEQDSLVSDMSLITDIRDFEVDDKSSGEVRLRLIAKLVNTKTREVVITVEFDKKQIPSANNMDAIIVAFNRLSLDAANEIIEKVKVGLNKAVVQPMAFKSH